MREAPTQTRGSQKAESLRWSRALVLLLIASLVALAGISSRAAGPGNVPAASGTEDTLAADGTENASAAEAPPPSDWTSCPVIAHALGVVDGRAGTNSRDAFLSSVRAGHQVLEVDLQLTGDGYLAARHDWDQDSYYILEQTFAGVMDRQAFLSTPICYYYTPLDADGLLALMQEYPHVYIVTDSKDADEKTVRAQFRALSEAMERAGDPSLWDRIIVQIYKEKMLGWVKEEAPVTNWIFTLYQIPKPNYKTVGAFCRDNNIPVVTVEDCQLNSKMAQTLHGYGQKIYVHTVNRLRAMSELSWAADGFYSDCVTPSQLEGVLKGTSGMYLSTSN